MRLLNEPKRREVGATATVVTAGFRVEGPGTESLPRLDARWSDTPQPSHLQPNETPRLAVEINAGSQRQINLAIKEPDSDDAFLFNNDSYRFPRGQNPAWRMGPGNYRAVVEIAGDGLKTKRFECHFVNRGQGGSFEVLSFAETNRRGRKEQLGSRRARSCARHYPAAGTLARSCRTDNISPRCGFDPHRGLSGGVAEWLIALALQASDAVWFYIRKQRPWVRIPSPPHFPVGLSPIPPIDYTESKAI